MARDGGHMVSLVLTGTGLHDTFTVDQSEPRDIVYELDFLEFDTISAFAVPQAASLPSGPATQTAGWSPRSGPPDRRGRCVS